MKRDAVAMLTLILCLIFDVYASKSLHGYPKHTPPYSQSEKGINGVDPVRE